MNWGPPRDENAWEPRFTKNVAGDEIRIGDIILGSTGDGWWKIDTLVKDRSHDLVQMGGLKVVGVDARGNVRLGKARGRLSATLREPRVKGW